MSVAHVAWKDNFLPLCRLVQHALSFVSPSRHTALFLMHTAHCLLHTTHITLHTSHCLLHSAHCTLHTANCTLHTAHSTHHTEHWTLHTAYCIHHSAHCTVCPTLCNATPEEVSGGLPPSSGRSGGEGRGYGLVSRGTQHGRRYGHISWSPWLVWLFNRPGVAVLEIRL